MDITVTGDDVSVEISTTNPGGTFTIGEGNTTPASGNEILVIDDHGNITLFGELRRADQFIFDRTGTGGSPIMEIGYVSGGWNKQVAIGKDGRVAVTEGVILPVLGAVPTGGSDGDVALYHQTSPSTEYGVTWRDGGTWYKAVLS